MLHCAGRGAPRHDRTPGIATGTAGSARLGHEARRTKSLYRYQTAIRAYLSVRPYDETAERLVTDTSLKAAETMSDPADLINRAVEVLQAASIDCRPSVPSIG